MSKKYFVLSTIILTFFLTSCDTEKEDLPVEILPEDLITMEVLDDYMFRDDVQYVDLRNYSSSFSSGFIYSFEQIPFFDYLDYRVFNRNDGYNFSPDQILNENELYRLFDKEKAIFLYANGCIRSAYLKDMLNYLGYERVYVLGGFYEYEGEHLLLGDGNYDIGSTFFSKTTSDNQEITYHLYGDLDLGRKISFVRIDMFDNEGVSMRTNGYSEVIDYNQQLTTLENLIISEVVTMNELHEYLLSEAPNSFNNSTELTIEIDDTLIRTVYKLISK